MKVYFLENREHRINRVTTAQIEFTRVVVVVVVNYKMYVT